MSVHYDSEAATAIQGVYDSPTLGRLGDRLEELLDILEHSPGDSRVRRERTLDPKLWQFTVYGDGEVFMVLWEHAGPHDEPHVRYAGLRP